MSIIYVGFSGLIAGNRFATLLRGCVAGELIADKFSHKSGLDIGTKVDRIRSK